MENTLKSYYFYNRIEFKSIIQSRMMYILLSVCLKLKFSATTEPIKFYSSGNIPTGHMTVLSCFHGGRTTTTPPQKKNFPQFVFFLGTYFLNYLLGQRLWGEVASLLKTRTRKSSRWFLPVTVDVGCGLSWIL